MRLRVVPVRQNNDTGAARGVIVQVTPLYPNADNNEEFPPIAYAARVPATKIRPITANPCRKEEKSFGREFGTFLQLFAFRQRLFEMAHLILAIGTAQGGIAAIIKALRMLGVIQFPAQHDQQRHKEKAPGKEALDEHHRRVHHHMTPVIDAAIGTAAILHHKRLEGAPEELADKIGKEVEAGKQQQFRFADNIPGIEHGEHAVAQHPDDGNAPGGQILLLRIFEQLQLIDRLYRL